MNLIVQFWYEGHELNLLMRTLNSPLNKKNMTHTTSSKRKLFARKSEFR